VDFKNTVVIMTSNVGSHAIADRALGGRGDLDEGLRRELTEALRQHFKPEFLNRIDEIVVFHRLDESHIARIVDLQVDVLRDRLAERGLGLDMTDAARAHIAQVGYDADFGARPLKRVLQREVSDAVALALLKGEFHDGDVVVVDASPDGTLVFSTRRPVAVD
jgi:ATP-dependent Clp protease ATP-binding subunit ClpB